MSIGASSRDARIAAALYFAWFIMAVVRAIYIPVSLFFQGNAAARILEHEATFRLAMLTDLTAAVLMVFVVLALYRLLAPVNRARFSELVVLRLREARFWITSVWPTRTKPLARRTLRMS